MNVIKGVKNTTSLKLSSFLDLDKKMVCILVIVELNRDYFSIYKKQYSNNIIILPT